MPSNNVKTILVVDDELPIVEIVVTILEFEGYQVLTAGDGKEALACLENSQVHLVLSDLMMPVMDGKELCNRIAADAAHNSIPVVLMSASPTVALLDGCKHDAFVKKPFELRELLTVVASVLGG